MDAPVSVKAENLLRDPGKARLVADAVRASRKAGKLSVPFEIAGRRLTVALVDSKSLARKTAE